MRSSMRAIFWPTVRSCSEPGPEGRTKRRVRALPSLPSGPGRGEADVEGDAEADVEADADADEVVEGEAESAAGAAVPPGA